MGRSMNRIPRSTQMSIATTYDNSGDLEAATKTVTATSKPGTADYMDTNALSAPSDSRLIVKCVGARLTVDVDSFNDGCTVLNYSIDIGSQAALVGTIVASGAGQIKVHNATGLSSHAGHAGQQAKIFFWVNAGNAVLSKVQLELAYGVCGNSAAEAFRITAAGLYFLSAWINRSGSGTCAYMQGCTYGSSQIGQVTRSGIPSTSGIYTGASQLCIAPSSVYVYGSVATDLIYIGGPTPLTVFLLEA